MNYNSMKPRRSQNNVGRSCAASFCRKVLSEQITSYPFPHISEKKLLQTWHKRLLSSPYTKGEVCYRHFSDKQLIPNVLTDARKDLKKYAIPDKNIVRRTRDPKDPLDAVCRLCLERSDMDYQMIFPAWPDPDVPTAKDIMELFGIVITPNDILPRLVCVTCSTKVKYMKRIRDQFKKNDAILRAKYTPEIDETDPILPTTQPTLPSHSQEQVELLVEPVDPKIKERHVDPKIKSVASLGKNAIAFPSDASGSGYGHKEAFGSVVYVQEGDTYQHFRIINSSQIMASSEDEATVSAASVKMEPPNLDETIDLETHYAKEGYVEPENAEVKIEHQQMISLYTDDDSQPEELAVQPPERSLRVDDTLRYYKRIKVERT